MVGRRSGGANVRLSIPTHVHEQKCHQRSDVEFNFTPNAFFLNFVPRIAKPFSETKIQEEEHKMNSDC